SDFEILGETESAIRDYTAILAIDPTDLLARLDRETRFEELGRHEEALADLDYLIANAPSEKDGQRWQQIGHMRRAEIRVELEQPASALDDLNIVLASVQQCLEEVYAQEFIFDLANARFPPGEPRVNPSGKIPQFLCEDVPPGSAQVDQALKLKA